MIGLNNRDKAWHDLYSLKISTGELKKYLKIRTASQDIILTGMKNSES